MPLSTPDGWEILSYTRIPPNEVRFGDDGLEIHVRRSASPVVYALPSPVVVTRVRASGRVNGTLALPDGATQGKSGADDYVLRVGLVESGDRRLGRLQRLGAAAWVKRLFSLAPPGEGISRVHFLNVAQHTSHIGAVRSHPLNDILFEHVVSAFGEDARFVVDHQLDRPTRVPAIWLSSDGDDTASTFSVTLERLILE
ncbi:MAG: hypothetical protein FJW23_12015 [Acidimicrobiia bacterium]|nr:hypothetical protein [Acidimicrobiia bacterium]